MKNKDRLFIGICCGVPFGMIGAAMGFLFAVMFNKIIGKER